VYHKHNTEGVIIRGSERGEASKDILLFTKEFGLIYASVQNARSLESKLRYSIQDFTIGNFVLVRGKHSWKMVGAEINRNIYQGLTLIANIFNLLRKLIGEEKNEELYEIIRNFLDDLENTDSNQTKNLETLTVLRILKNQGLLEENEKQIEILSGNLSQAIKTINASLSAAQLSL